METEIKPIEESLQEKWDKYLVTAWFANKGARMSLLTFRFFGHTHWENKRALSIRRVPIESWENRLDVFGYVAQYIPKLSEWLLSTKRTDTVRIDKILVAMQKLDKVQPKADRELSKITSKATKSIRAAKVVTTANAIYAEYSRNYNRGSGARGMKNH